MAKMQSLRMLPGARCLLHGLDSYVHGWGPLSPSYPLHPPEHIAFVGAAMKMHGYRSFSTYPSRAKEAHVAAGHTWAPRHELDATESVRSVTQGQGLPRQSAPLPIESVAGLDLGFQALCQGGLVNPRDTAVLESAFILREIELAAARLLHVHVDTSACRFSLKLPISKTDLTAVGHVGVCHLDRITSFRNSVRRAQWAPL